jgi:acyl dehydratase
MMPTRYFEDFAADQVFEAGSVTVTEDEIITFARQYDPQAMHVDPVRARETIYGGLIASGWHTAALSMRLLVDGIFGATVGMGSPGVDELRWLRPVRPGDTLSVRLTILEARASESRPDRGIIRFRVEARNQGGELVMQMTGAAFIARRAATS